MATNETEAYEDYGSTLWFDDDIEPIDIEVAYKSGFEKALDIIKDWANENREFCDKEFVVSLNDLENKIKEMKK